MLRHTTHNSHPADPRNPARCDIHDPIYRPPPLPFLFHHTISNRPMIVFNLAARVAASILSVPPDAITLCLPMMAPPPTSLSQCAHRAAIDEVLREAWGERDGFEISSEETSRIDGMYRGNEPERAEGGKSPSIYGEVTSLGARQLFGYMGMCSGPFSPRRAGQGGSEEMTFYDLGSGAGRLVVQSYLELPRVRRAVGVELSPSRHKAAVRAWSELMDSRRARDVRGMGILADSVGGSGGDGGAAGPDSGEGGCVELCEGDLFQLDVESATHVYASSLCFTEEMMAKLANKLEGEAPVLRCVASLQKFPPGSLFGISHPLMEWVEMSWTKDRGEGCPVYFYYNEGK